MTISDFEIRNNENVKEEFNEEKPREIWRWERGNKME
jgi:hypothetical protein